MRDRENSLVYVLGMGRRPIPDEDKRKSIMVLKGTDDDLAAIDERAAAVNATRNEYVLARALGRRPKPRKSPRPE